MDVNLLTFCYVILGGGGKIGECIATELAKENVTLVLWDVNESKCRVLGVV
jgi:Trk K+ transport system NAD-binding subunit